ncbi:MAG: ArnT family glycosyltransferase, partial [Terriglobia bacterium]
MSDPAAHSSGDAPEPRLNRRTIAVCWAVILTADLACLWFFESHGLSNLYGDGIAHVEGARRLFDSLTPGYPEIGSVWLPLFHILAAPLALNNTLWRTGLAGSLISAAAFALTAWLLFKFSFEMNRCLAAAAVTLTVFLIAPNSLYVAATPLTEPLAVFWAVLVVYGLFRFQRSGRTGTCVWTAIAAFGGTLTRYDGWFLLPFAALFVFFCRPRDWKDRWGQTLVFCLIAGTGPLLWLLHNAYRFHNAFQFYNGPYSAKAIYAHQLATTGYRYPTDGSLWLSAHYYFEAVRLVFGPWTLMLALVGLVVWLVDQRMRGRRFAALLLWAPFLFYAQSMAHGSIPIYLPTLPPHTYYNLRYGIE